MKNIVFSIVHSSDLAQICALEKECFSTPWSEQQFIMALKNKAFSIFVAKEDEIMLGYVSILRFGQSFESAATEFAGGELEIVNIAVLPERRRQGLAKHLLSIVLQVAAKTGIVKAALEVRVSNAPAITLYSSLGFQEAGRRPAYYQDTGEDAIVMTRELEAEDESE